MTQKITHGAITMFCFVLTFLGMTLKFNYGQNNPEFTTGSYKNNIKSTNDITVVYPNPESGVLNLHCCDDFKSPITIKALNTKEIVVKSINTLLVDGANKFKFVQINTLGLSKGEYTIVMTDIIGKIVTRKIYIAK